MHSAHGVAASMPFFADRLGELKDWEQIKLLTVAVDRMPRWHRPGLLCIGDAAHAMSPIGGVGINLAVQDAVAAANILWEPLSRGHAGEDDLARVQKRREFPARVTQAIQVFLQNRVVSRALQREGRDGRALGGPVDRAFSAAAAHPGAPARARRAARACPHAQFLILRSRPKRASRRDQSQTNRGTKRRPSWSIWQRCGAPKCCGASRRAGPPQFSSVMRRDLRAVGWSRQAKLFQAG